MKTSELTGAALDWAVARCEGELDERGFYPHESTGAFMLERGEVSWVYSPSTKWEHGGPIIEREKIGIDCDDQGVWFASYDLSAETAWGATGPTPLIAAMRCYVASKLGDEVNIPEELK